MFEIWNWASKIDQGVVISPKCRLYILMANPNYKDTYTKYTNQPPISFILSSSLVASFFIFLSSFFACNFLLYFFAPFYILINCLFYKQIFIWSKAKKTNRGGGWYVQFVLIHDVIFITHSNTNRFVHHNCVLPFKNMVFQIEFHISSN